jgi:hypothetical protein
MMLLLFLFSCKQVADSEIEPAIHIPTIQIDHGDCNSAPDLPHLGGAVLATTCAQGRCNAAQWLIQNGQIHLASCTGGSTWEIAQMVP